MPDLEKILRLVEQGILSPEEADEILTALAERSSAGTNKDAGDASRSWPDGDRARHLRIQITESGRQVVNLRVPMNVASFAAGIVPGLPDDEAERIRETIRTGTRGPIVDITSNDGDRVLIVSE